MISTVSLYFGVSKPAKKHWYFQGFGWFWGLKSCKKTISISKGSGSFWVPKHVKNHGISMVFAGAAGARPAGQSAKEKRWHRKVFLGKSFSPINQAGPAL